MIPWKKPDQKPDYSVYLVTDQGLCLGRKLIDVVMQAVQGGVTMVQLREKNADTRTLIELAQELVALLHPKGVPLLVNDRVGIALAAGAAGVHVGHSDMLPSMARDLMGPDAIIGYSVNSREHLLEAVKLGAVVDYLAISPVFPTTTKSDTGPSWGLEGLAWAAQNSRHPLVVIGGVNEANARSLVQAGAKGLAVVSAVCSAPDPKQAARKLQACF